MSDPTNREQPSLNIWQMYGCEISFLAAVADISLAV